MEENVGRFLYEVVRSLSAGTVRCGQFSVQFKLDVFRYLFSSKGRNVPRTSSKSFDLTDFCSDFFVGDWYIVYDKHGNGCCVDFPIVLNSKLRYGPRYYVKNDDRW